MHGFPMSMNMKQRGAMRRRREMNNYPKDDTTASNQRKLILDAPRLRFLVILGFLVATLSFHFEFERTSMDSMGIYSPNIRRTSIVNVAKDPPIANLTKTKNSSTQQVPDKEKPELILHVGPKKTATTSIQIGLFRNNIFLESLEQDNIWLPNNPHMLLHQLKSRLEGRGAKITEFQAFKILEEFQLRLRNALPATVDKGKSTVLCVSEALPNIPSEKLTKSLFQSLMKDWNVTITMTYRNPFSWLVSEYAQKRKGEMYFSSKNKWADYQYAPESPQSSFAGFYSNYINMTNDRLSTSKDSLASYEYFADIFGEDRIRVIDMEDPEGVTTAFVCKGVQANHSCSVTRANSKLSEATQNSVKFLHEHDLIIQEAFRRGLITEKTKDDIDYLSRHEATVVLRDTLKSSNVSIDILPRICISKSQQDDLWSRTIRSEEFFRGLMGQPTALDALRLKFDSYIESKRFCSVNTTAVLADTRFQEFFRSCAMNQPSVCATESIAKTILNRKRNSAIQYQ